MKNKLYKISITISWPDDYYYELYPEGYLVIELPELISEKMLANEVSYMEEVLSKPGQCRINNYIISQKLKEVCIFEINKVPQVEEIKAIKVGEIKTV